MKKSSLHENSLFYKFIRLNLLQSCGFPDFSFRSLFFLALILPGTICTAMSIEGIVHPESAFTTRDGRIFISEIGKVGVNGDGRILEIFTDGKKKVVASGLNDPKGLLVE